MANKIYVEFFGLPGVGKTTMSKDLVDIFTKNSRYSVIQRKDA